MIVKLTMATYYLYFIWGKVKTCNITNVQIQNKGIFIGSKSKLLSLIVIDTSILGYCFDPQVILSYAKKE